MIDKTLVSMDNIVEILGQVVSNLKTKINNKDICLPYKTQLDKSTYIKIDGDGSMYLSNNGIYIEFGDINKSNLDIQKIYELFKINKVAGYWDNNGIANMTTARYGLTCQVFNDKIYCIGGHDGNNYINKVEIYDIASNTWTTGANMPINVGYLTSQLYNGKIYCIAGAGSTKVEIYDIASNTWTTGINIISTRYELASVLSNGKIYCIGGFGANSSTTNKVEIYDIANNSWTVGTPIPANRGGLSSVYYNGKIYCMGGYTNITVMNRLDIYDIENNSWTTDKPMPNPRAYFISEIYNGSIYCIGGINSNKLDIYDIATGIWSTITSPISVDRNHLSSAIYNNKIYCIGGLVIDKCSNKIEIYHLPCYKYSIILPASINNKLSKIINNDNGNKYFINNYEYKEIVLSVTTMDSTQIDNSLNIILNS